MSDYDGHHNDLDTGLNNIANELWGNTAEWNWPSDVPEHALSPTLTHNNNNNSTVPHYHRQLPPLSHVTPIASLTAALRGESQSLAPYYPSSPRRHQTGRESSFGYVPDYLFYSPPESREPSPEDDVAASANDRSSSRNNQSSHALWRSDPRSSGPSAGPSNRPATPQPVDSSADSSHCTMPRTTGSSTRKRPRDTAATIDLDESPRAKKPRRSGAIQQIDLAAEEDAKQALLDKEREELVKRQKEESGRAVKINDLTCMICLERFTNMTVTHCGHIFCHECLTQALNASERASERNVGACPACRKPIKRAGNSKNQIIPLALMKRPKQQRRGPRRSSKTSISLQ